MTDFYAELRRRKVLRVAGLYIVGAWVLIQVAGEAFEAWGIAEHALRYVWIAAILGFPLSIVFGWRYDIVGGRIVRTPAAEAADPVDTSLQRVDYVVLAALAVVVAAIALGVARRAADAPGGPVETAVIESKSVAVLPFENMSSDDSTLPFTVGIHDDILTQISKIGELKVISRTSVARLDPTLTIREIGRLLRVATVLEGGVQRAGDQLRINVQLIDAGTDRHVWAETFDRELTTQNIFAIQSEIAEAVAAALRATLSPREKQNLRKTPTQNLDAYEAYLLGRQRMALRTIPELERAAQHFSQAIGLDPEFALAYVGLADTALLLNSYGALSLDQALERSRPLLERALELDDQLGAAHASIGLSFGRQSTVSRTDEEAKRIMGDAAANYQRAIDLDPNYAPAYHWYGGLLIEGPGDFLRAVSMLEQARELDPLSPVINVTLGEAYEGLGRFDDALAIYDKVVSMEPDYPGSYFLIAQLQRFAFGRIDEAIRWHVEELRKAPYRTSSAIGFAYLDLGDDERAGYWFDRAMTVNPDDFWSVAGMSQLHRYRGEAEEAIRYAERLDQIAPGNNLTLVTLVSFGRDEQILELVRERLPDLSCDGPLPISRHNLPHAINYSLALERTDNSECANRLLDLALGVMSTMPRLGVRGYAIGDVEIYARQGRTELALATLREAIDMGWRSWQWALGPGSPHNANIVDDPRFITMMDEVSADLAGQLENVRRMETAGELDLP